MNRIFKTALGNRGMTLVEILVAVAIMAVIVTPLLHAFVTGANTERKSREYGEATAAAQALVEEVEALGAVNYLSGRTPDDPNADELSYTIDRRDFEYDDKTYDARLVFTARHGGTVNDKSILVGNEMDIMLDCTGIDEDIFNEYLAECTDMGWTDPAIARNNLTRTITLDVGMAENSSGYKVTATFNYNGFVHKMVAVYDEDDNFLYDEEITEPFNRDVKSTGRCSKKNTGQDSTAAFSLYLFYNPYVGETEILTLNNNLPENKDVKLFIVGTPEPAPGVRYTLEVNVTKQYNRDVSRVFTNLQNVIYRAFNPGSPQWFTPTDSAKSLVETQVVDRFFDVEVSLYRPGTDYSEDSLIVTIDSANLTDNPLALTGEQSNETENDN